MDKEFEQIVKAITKWAKSHGNNVCFYGSFLSFNDKNDLVFAHGTKKCLVLECEEVLKRLKEEKEDFVSWSNQ